MRALVHNLVPELDIRRRMMLVLKTKVSIPRDRRVDTLRPLAGRDGARGRPRLVPLAGQVVGFS